MLKTLLWIRTKRAAEIGAFWLVALIGGTSILSGQAQSRPNILFIFTDDHAVQSIGAYGSTINETPHIDRLAQEGGIFLNSFCSNSICGPSRASVLTGKHSHKNGFYTNARGARFDGSQMTFPKLLQEAGYATALIGKWHLNSDPTGFDHWEILPGQGSYYNPDLYASEGREDIKRYEGYVTDVIVDLSLEWLDERDPDKPFLLMCQQKAPHRTWAPNLKHLYNYDSSPVPEPPTLFDNWSGRSDTLANNAMSIKDHFIYQWDMKFQDRVPFANDFESRLDEPERNRMNPQQQAAWDAYFEPRNQAFLASPPVGKELIRWKYQRYIKNYLRCIDSVDENVGRLLTYLDANGLSENTIVIYSSDQGFYLGEHGWYDKRWMYEESLRMPFLIRWPGKIAPGTKYRQLLQNIDYAPTFMEAAGVPVPKEIQGHSILPILENPESENWRKYLYYHYYEHLTEHGVPRHEGVRGQRYKLINYYSNDGFELIDLQTDPNEMRDVSEDPRYAEVLETMKSVLGRLRQRYDLPSLAESAVH